MSTWEDTGILDHRARTLYVPAPILKRWINTVGVVIITSLCHMRAHWVKKKFPVSYFLKVGISYTNQVEDRAKCHACIYIGHLALSSTSHNVSHYTTEVTIIYNN